MQNSVLIYILCTVIVLLVIAVVFMAMRLRALNRFIESRHAVPLSVIKDAVSKKYNILKIGYKLLYNVCDNFPKHSEKLGKLTARAYLSGATSDLCCDIVFVTNMCEGGAINKLALQYRLTEQETRTCCFIYWDFRWQETCLVENISENAYNVRCSRIRKKFNLTKEETIPAFIGNFCRDNSVSFR